MRVLAIDPGTAKSAWVIFNTVTWTIEKKDIEKNEVVLACLRWVPMFNCDVLAIEKIEAMGMAVGGEVFETVYWSGRFHQRWLGGRQHNEQHELSMDAILPQSPVVVRIPRREIKLHLCGSCRAKDPNVRQALMDKFGYERAVGTKTKPGPLYGIKSHLWSALAVAVTYVEQNCAKPIEPTA